jgi:PadR family transcriptional regulator AphA
MHQAGWVTFATIIQHDSPNKKIYSVTEAGHQELERWLREPTNEMLPSQAWLAQFYFGDNLNSDELMHLLRLRRMTLTESLMWTQNQQAIVEADSSLDGIARDLRLLTLQRTIELNEIEIQWIDAALKQVVNNYNT